MDVCSCFKCHVCPRNNEWQRPRMEDVSAYLLAFYYLWCVYVMCFDVQQHSVWAVCISKERKMKTHLSFNLYPFALELNWSA